MLQGIAADTWKFYGADVDPNTHLPLDNLGPGAVRGDLHLGGEHRRVPVGGRRRPRSWPDRPRAGRLADHRDAGRSRFAAALRRLPLPVVRHRRTATSCSNPGQGDCTETTPAQDNCWFVSAVDNGWYASGLIEVREALPELRGLADRLLDPMNFAIFYDNRAQTDCNVNAALGNPAHRDDVRRFLRRPGASPLPRRHALQRPPDRDLHRDGHAPDARRRLVADVADTAAQAVPDRPGLLLAGSVAAAGVLADLHRPAVRQDSSTSGRATTPTPGPR